MSTIAEIKIDGKAESVFADKFSIGSFRTVSSLDGSVGVMQGASAKIQMGIEEESDSESFFATWFMDGSKKNMTVEFTKTGELGVFLTVTCLDARVVNYDVIFDAFIQDTDNSNTFITVSCASITVGSAALSNGF